MPLQALPEFYDAKPLQSILAGQQSAMSFLESVQRMQLSRSQEDRANQQMGLQMRQEERATRVADASIRTNELQQQKFSLEIENEIGDQKREAENRNQWGLEYQGLWNDVNAIEAMPVETDADMQEAVSRHNRLVQRLSRFATLPEAAPVIAAMTARSGQAMSVRLGTQQMATQAALAKAQSEALANASTGRGGYSFIQPEQVAEARKNGQEVIQVGTQFVVTPNQTPEIKTVWMPRLEGAIRALSMSPTPDAFDSALTEYTTLFKDAPTPVKIDFTNAATTARAASREKHLTAASRAYNVFITKAASVSLDNPEEAAELKARAEKIVAQYPELAYLSVGGLGGVAAVPATASGTAGSDWARSKLGLKKTDQEMAPAPTKPEVGKPTQQPPPPTSTLPPAAPVKSNLGYGAGDGVLPKALGSAIRGLVSPSPESEVAYRTSARDSNRFKNPQGEVAKQVESAIASGNPNAAFVVLKQLNPALIAAYEREAPERLNALRALAQRKKDTQNLG